MTECAEAAKRSCKSSKPTSAPVPAPEPKFSYVVPKEMSTRSYFDSLNAYQLKSAIAERYLFFNPFGNFQVYSFDLSKKSITRKQRRPYQ
jgi:hypothetical protein